MEFSDNENATFDEVMEVLKKHPDFQKYEMQNESKLSFSGIEIYPERRKVYCNSKEIHLTAKEYRLLWLLVVNKGQVLTYQQLYEKVWGDISSGNESTAIGYHICNLRDKLYDAFHAIYIDSLVKISGCFSLSKLAIFLDKNQFNIRRFPKNIQYNSFIA